MDIAFNRKSWTPDPANLAGESPATPEWHGLRARFLAAHSARRVLGGTGSQGEAATAGSFDHASARLLADYGERLSDVNPVFWANGKSVRTMDADVAGESSLGDRG